MGPTVTPDLDPDDEASTSPSPARWLLWTTLVVVGGAIGLQQGMAYAAIDSQSWTGLPPTLGPMIAGAVFIGGGLLLGGILSIAHATRPAGKAVLLFIVAVIAGSFAGLAVGARPLG